MAIALASVETERSVEVQTLPSREHGLLARHPGRPRTHDYLMALCTDFVELRGDRAFGDDPAIVGGVGSTALGTVVVLGHRQGHTTHESRRHNFGAPRPEGYRKAMRLMRHAEKFNLPLICFLDTPGAQVSVEAEQRGQASIIAQCIMTLTSLRVPIISVIVNETNLNDGLLVGPVDRVLMLEHACVSADQFQDRVLCSQVSSPACADPGTPIQLSAHELYARHVVDQIVPEPPGGAHAEPEQAMAALCHAVMGHLAELRRLEPRQLHENRYARSRVIEGFDRAGSNY